ncbi:MAG: endonuclease [Clostridia bacterium]|nr:endonuclease [Clostridia bacterium]
MHKIYELLYEAYGPQNWWPADSVEEMMVGAVLVQNTAWTNVEKSLEALESFSPSYIRNVEHEELIRCIRTSGFYMQKARTLKNLMSWFQKYNDDILIARTKDERIIRSELLELKGIGYETADCMMVYALEKPYFIIDAYTRRIFERLNIPLHYNYLKAQAYIQDNLEVDVQIFNEFHALLVKHGKKHCMKKPRCISCPLGKYCYYYQSQEESIAFI